MKCNHKKNIPNCSVLNFILPKQKKVQPVCKLSIANWQNSIPIFFPSLLVRVVQPETKPSIQWSIFRQKAYAAAPHLSCVASTKDNIRAILKDYQDNGIAKIVALRGDLPSGMMSAGEFRYANELVEFIRQETGDYFQIHVAAYPEVHPQSASATEDFKNFKRKVEAGANAAITQYFYNAEAYFYFVDTCEKNGIYDSYCSRHYADYPICATVPVF